MTKYRYLAATLQYILVVLFAIFQHNIVLPSLLWLGLGELESAFTVGFSTWVFLYTVNVRRGRRA